MVQSPNIWEGKEIRARRNNTKIKLDKPKKKKKKTQRSSSCVIFSDQLRISFMHSRPLESDRQEYIHILFIIYKHNTYIAN